MTINFKNPFEAIRKDFFMDFYFYIDRLNSKSKRPIIMKALNLSKSTNL